MRLLLAVAALAAGTFVSAGWTAAQSQPRPECGDDNGVDRCAPEQHRRVLALYGMQAIETHAAAGDEVRRAFYVDGYGRDTVAIAFVRAPGRDPTVSVHFPRQGEVLPPPLTALVPGNVWSQVLERSAYFDRDLVPLPARQDPGTVSICLHSWVYTVEATRRAPPDENRLEVRRKVQDACGDGLAEAYANDIPELALPLFPACAALDRGQHRNIATLLGACRLLSGDRLAAAEAFNLLSRLRYVDAQDRRQVDGVFGQRAVIDWAGQRTSGGTGQAVDAWLRRVTENDRTNMHIARVTGERANQVRAEAELIRYVDGPNDTSVAMVAPVTFELTDFRDGQGLRVSHATVGPFAERSGD